MSPNHVPVFGGHEQRPLEDLPSLGQNPSTNSPTQTIMSNLEKITCPTCGKKNTWREDNTYRPFCSDRCKLIDLGEWASEKHKIPGDPVDLNIPNQEEDY